MPDIIKITICSAYDSTMNEQTKNEDDSPLSHIENPSALTTEGFFVSKAKK
mgnify:FL=1